MQENRNGKNAVRFVAAGLIGTATLLLTGCPVSTGNDSIVDVLIQDLKFQPKEIQIRKGQIVRWNNGDGFAHTVTSGDPSTADMGVLFNSGAIPANGTYSYQFLSVGEFEYFCLIHFDMESMRHAKVIVTE